MNKKDEVLLNERIRFPQVRCIGEDGTQYGIISSEEANKLANEQELDLVLIAQEATPPVCKIMDYSKYRYQEEKKAKEARKKQVIIDIKELKLTIKIAQNDINYKIKHAIEFLEEKKYVKFRVFLSGREMANPQAGINLLNNVYDMVKEYGDAEKAPYFEGRYVNMMVIPKKPKQQQPGKKEHTETKEASE